MENSNKKTKAITESERKSLHPISFFTVKFVHLLII